MSDHNHKIDIHKNCYEVIVMKLLCKIYFQLISARSGDIFRLR